MKSKTFFCEKTLLKKNLRRFAPFWGLFTLALLMGLSVLVQDYRGRFDLGMHLARNSREMAPFMLAYGLLMGELLFGDLFDSRMCSGIHALPLRREQIFSVNLLSGLLSCLIPTAVMALAAIPFLMGIPMEQGWLLAPLWFAALNLQFLFFFGLASFCAMLAGTRLAMALLYGIVNFASVLIYFPFSTIYVPLLVGVMDNSDPFQRFCPTLQMADTILIECERNEEINPVGHFQLGEGWGYLLLCAGIGVALMAGALLLYRSRKLECAGDFLSLPRLKPLFQITAGLLAGAAAYMFSGIFFGTYYRWTFQLIFIVTGMAVGWFAARMLLDKTLRVFRRSSVLGLLALMLAVGASVGITALDPLGIEDRIPEVEEVESVRVDDFYYGTTGREEDVFRSPEDIEKVVRLQELAISQDLRDWNRHELYQFQESYHLVNFRLQYTLKNGKQLNRYYYVTSEGESGDLARDLFGRVERVIPRGLRNFDWADRVTGLSFNGLGVDPAELSDLEGLVEAVKLDAESGSLCPVVGLHPDWIDDQGLQNITVYFNFRDLQSFQIVVFQDSEHTMKWLTDHGVVDRLTAGFRDA